MILAEYGDAAGLGMIEGRFVTGILADSDRMYIGARDHVVVFDLADGSFLARVGRRGEGPGEMLDVAAMALVRDGVLVVVDRGRGVLLKFDWAGALLQEVRLRNWVPTGVGLIPLSEELAVYEGHMRTADRVGYPLHLVNLEAGEIVRSFGSLTGEYDPRRARSLSVTSAAGPEHSIWMGRLWAYRIELWEPNNNLLLSMRRNLPWFPDALVRPTDIHTPKPDPALLSLAADDSLLWVLIHRADEGWRDASKHDDKARHDSFVEVIDWRRGQVVASQRFDEMFYPWLGPGLTGEMVITPDGSMRFRVRRLGLVAGNGSERSVRSAGEAADGR